jgi:hypothetical protein
MASEREEADPRSDWVQLLDRVGRELMNDTPELVPLGRDDLVSAATRATGLSDFGPDDFIEPLDILLDSLDRESNLTLLGRILVRSDILNLLQNRLRIAELVRREPRIREQQVEQPIFIVGLPRSGTTILHELLSLDPNLRAPLTWEVRFPCPPPTEADQDTDPRIASAERIFDLWNHLVPDFRTMHEMGAQLPCECIWLTAHSFRCEEFLGRQQTPSYGAWLATADLGPAYSYHRLMLQVFQWGRPTERWVLKAPSHMGAMPFLFGEYPDARIVQTHRDPLQSMASTGSLLAAHAWMRADQLDRELIALGFAGEGMASRLDAVIQARDEDPERSKQFFDVRFQDLMKDPVGVLESVYEHVEMEFVPSHAERIRSYLAAKPRGMHGRHEYRLEDMGIELAQERDRFSRYQERFSVQSEL